MIKRLTVKNFKSIKELQLECRRVNLFIGEPNVGKSNILEALSVPTIQQTLSVDGLIRMNDLSNLFFENDPSNKILVECDEIRTEIYYEEGIVSVSYKDKLARRILRGSFQTKDFDGDNIRWDYGIHRYSFKLLQNFPNINNDFLSVPFGDNLFFLLQTNKALRALISDFIQDKGFKLTLRQATKEIEISKEKDSLLIAYPYTLISDTIQRIIFYIAAIETNKPGVSLIFEEPESNVFPYYTKYLAEKIGYDTDKQYFITTHNPYFLQSVIEKTHSEDLSVHLVDLKNYQTEVHTLSRKGVSTILDLNSDVFLNFDALLES
jgi:AAA15 family ATPase/GTPase